MNPDPPEADPSFVPPRSKRWLAPVAGLVLGALVATPFALAIDKGAPADDASGPPEREAEAEAEQLGPLDEPVLGTEPVEFGDGRNHLVVELPDELVEVTDGTLLGTGDRTRLPDLSLLVGADEIVTDAEGRTWIRGGTASPTETLVSSSEIPTVLAELPDTDVVRIDATHFALTTSLDEDAVSAIPGVVAVSPDEAATVSGTNDPQFANQWALENRGDRYVAQPGDATAGSDIRAAGAWRASRGRDVVVAVIDTGVDFSHPDLENAAWTNPGEVCGNGIDDERNGFVDDCNGWDFYRNDSTVWSAGDHPHGTNVAGVVAATAGNGVGIAGAAPEAKIMALQVSNGPTISFSAAAAAINYAVANGADVINASWAGSRYTLELLAAVNRAADAGVVMAVASGNNAVNTDLNPFYPAAFVNSNIISVGASTPSDRMAYFSNYGANSVDLFAPGWYVLTTTTGAGYGYGSGTSFAAPYVAGTLALMLALDPALTPVEAHARLIDTATDGGAFAGRSVSGGRLDAEAATRSVTLPVSHSFSGFDAFDDLGQLGTVNTVAEPGVLPASALGYRVTVATQDAGVAVGVADEPVAYTLPGGATGVARTDEAGEALLSADAGFDPGAIARDALGISTELPAGTYALVVELIDLASKATVGHPHAVVYDVRYTGGNDTPPDPTPPPPVPSTPTTTPSETTPPDTTAPESTPSETTPPETTPPETTPPDSTPSETAPSDTTAPDTTAPPETTPPETTPPETTPPTAPAPTLTPTTVPLPKIPAKPTKLKGVALDGAARLQWAPGKGTTPTGYRVWRDGKVVAQTTNAEIVLGGLVNGRRYRFAVSAYNTGGESKRTGTVAVTPLAPLPPTAPPYVAPTTAPAAPPVTEPAADTTPPTTAPPDSTPPDTTPPTTAPETARRFELSPDRGTADGGTRVSIAVPDIGAEEVLAVFIGSRAQRLEYQSGGTVAVTTRPHTAGTFDVEVLTDARTIHLPDAYTFEAPTDEAAPTPTTAPSAPQETNPPSTARPAPTPTTASPATSPPATSAPVTSPPQTSPAATSPPVTSPPTTVANGAPPRRLPTRRITPGKPLQSLPTGMWNAVSCTRSPCSGIVL